MDERGFVLPVVVFGLMLMGTMTVAALLTAGDEARSGRAMREATGAFYAAEAGLNWVYANWDTVKADVDTLSGGNHIDLGWRTLDNGDSYRAVIYRWDEGTQPIYQLEVEGRSGGVIGSQKRLSYMLTSAPGEAGEAYKLGACCEAPAVVKGTFGQRGSPSKKGEFGQVFQSGYDTHPPGWEAAGVCSDSLYDKPGVMMVDTSEIELDPPDAVLEGVPPIVEDTTMSDSLFEYFGEYRWGDIRDRTNIVIDSTGWAYMSDGSNPIDFGSNLEGDEVYPRYTVDPLTGELLCDTSHPLNWGSDDPNDPCFNHFPVILQRGEVDLRGGPAYGGDRFYGQGIILMDYDTIAMTGAELEFEHEAEFRGLVLGRGCVEVQYGAELYGSIYLDATFDGITCDKSTDLWVNCNSYVDKGYPPNPCESTTIFQWSQCAVDRALVNSDLYEMAEPQVPGPGGGPQLLGNRAFGEGFR
ncbi:MAG: hypothetical protein PVJ64_00800 [Gemmatimonadales bacterium]